MNILIKRFPKNNTWSPVVPTKVFDAYWYFAAERQNIFFKRWNGMPCPWTEDLILQSYKFTNAYRASDRVSQFLIKNVIYGNSLSARDILFRILLFKIFNRIDTWLILEQKLGTISFRNFSFEKYDKILSKLITQKAIYSAAYIMPSGGGCFGYSRKHQNHLAMLNLMMNSEMGKNIEKIKSMQELFLKLREFPMIGDFLAYQYATDINYSELTHYSEMSFVMPGPGAYSGIAKCFSNFGGLSEIDLINIVAERQDEEFERRGIIFKNLWGRKLQLIDCQNLFCEIDKYSRVAFPDIRTKQARNKIKQKFRPNTAAIDYYYPPKWGVNINKPLQ